MSRIFISYRRSDSPDIVGRIYDRLLEALPDCSVFRDIDSIPLGVSFPLFLKEALDNTQAALVVIGPGWLKANDASGRRRLDDPGDFVRIEVETALRSLARVIPVTVGGAPLPTADQLPDTCRDLANRNALAVRQDPDFRRDMTRLITELEAVIGLTPSLPRLGTAMRLELGVLRFFRAQGKHSPSASLVFGEATLDSPAFQNRTKCL
jgi:hypothetical protein